MNAVNWCVALVTAIGSVSVCGAAPAAHPDAHSRTRRQTKQYFVDILVLADYSLYRQWYDRSQANGTLTRDQVAKNDMRRYLTLVVNEVSLQYSRMQTSFRLNVRPVGFYIQNVTTSSSPWVRLEGAGLVNAEPLLNELVTWLQSETSLTQYDHAMLFTGCDLSTDGSGHTTGRATVGTLCQGDRTHSVSVIEDRGAFQSVRTVVHELGHSLNANHDGTANVCVASDNFIMAPGFMNETTENKRNPWYFSACTVQEIQSFVNNIISSSANRLCLENSFTPQSVPDVTGVVPGQLYGPNDMCKHLYGPESSYCYHLEVGNLSNICTYMPCWSGLKCYVHFAATGTSCGTKQWCQAGECVGSINAPSLGDCPFGDQNVLVNGLTCAQMAEESPQLCYDEYTRAVCCQSCRNKHSGKQGCAYGNRKGGCSSDVCERIEPNGYMYATDCCGTCDFDPTSWTCADQPKVGGRTCAEAVRWQGVQGCYDTSLAYACCATCSQQRKLTRPQGCEYGNLLLTGCGKSSTAPVSNCDAKTCCATCSAVTGTGNTHHVTLPVVAVVFLYNFWVLLYAPFST